MKPRGACSDGAFVTDPVDDAEFPTGSCVTEILMAASDAEAIAIDIQDVGRSFGSQRVLDRVSTRFMTGRATFVVGPSGCGKSLLMKMLVGLETPDSGRILVFGKHVATMNAAELNGLRRRVAFVPQHPALFDSLTVGANIALPLVFHRIQDEAAARSTAVRLLSLFNLADRADLLPGQISQSDRKIVSILRSMACGPECLVLDEPTTGLDSPSRDAVFSMIREIGLVDSGIETLIVVSHDMQSTMAIADRIVFLYKGVVRHDTSPAGFLTATATDPIAAQFLAGAADGPMNTEADEA